MITEWYEVAYFIIIGALLVAVVYFWFRGRLLRSSWNKRMKVKVLRAENATIDLLIDGVPYTYLVSRSRPLAARDIAVARQVLDFSLMESLCRAGSVTEAEHPLTRLWDRFVFRLCKRERPAVAQVRVMTQAFGIPAVGRYIRENGVPVDIDGTTYTIVSPALLEALERGELDEEV